MSEGPPDRETEMVALRKDMERQKTELEGKIEVVRTEVFSLRWFVQVIIAVFGVIAAILGVAVAILARAADLI